MKGLLLLKPKKIFYDERGFFLERYRASFFEFAGNFVQDNLSFSKKNTLRGLHFQKGGKQTKLVSVIKGKILDVAVDVRPSSPTFGKWEGIILDGENNSQLLIPGGFAHGFLALEDSFVFYKTTTYYDETLEKALFWQDPDIAITWPITDPIISNKDKSAPLLKDFDI